MQIELHPLCTLFPRMSGAEFDALKADIVANGLSQPIVLHDGLILDGGNRYHACVDAGVAPSFVEFDGANLVSFVLSANMHRRHLSPGQQAAIVASAQDWSRANSHGGSRQSDQGATLHLDSAASRAAQSGASLRTQKMADSVAKKSPELAKQVAHGEISLPKAVEQLTPRTPAQSAVTGDAPDFGVLLAASTAGAPTAASVSLDDLGADDSLDPMEQLRESEARVEKLQNQVDELTARVRLLSQSDVAAKLIEIESDRDGYRNLSAAHFEKWTKANTDAIKYKKLLDKLCKTAGVEKHGDLFGAITPTVRG